MRLNSGLPWQLQLVTPPAKEPLEVDQLGADHIRVLEDAEEQEYIQGLIVVCREHAEGFLRRPLITQVWRLLIDQFPRTIDLPLPPLQSVDTIKYIATDGVQTLLPSSEYKVSPVPTTARKQKPRRSRIRPAFGFAWPSTQHETDAVEVEFTCGYGDDGEDIPAVILHGMKMVGAELYIQRKQSLQDVFMHEAAIKAENLWWRYRLH